LSPTVDLCGSCKFLRSQEVGTVLGLYSIELIDISDSFEIRETIEINQILAQLKFPLILYNLQTLISSQKFTVFPKCCLEYLNGESCLLA
jgi:hypothetical protein